MELTKTTRFLVLTVILLVAFAAAAAAQDDTGNETGAFTSPLGAKVRLLMLQSSIERNILAGDDVVAAIKADNASADTSGLEALLGELQALKDEVTAAAENPGSGEDAARAFVDMKSDAVEISKEFRESARTMIKVGDVEGLKSKIKDLTNDSRQELKRELNETRNEYNAEKVGDVLSSIGISDPALIEKIRLGEAKLKDVKDAIKDATANMTKQERLQVSLKLREQLVKGNIFIRAVADKVAFNQLDRIQGRLEKRLENADKLNLSEGAKMRLENRSELVTERMDKIRLRFQDRIEKVGNLTQKKIQRIDQLENKLENRTKKGLGRLDALRNKTEEEGEKLQDRLGNMLNNGAKGHGGGDGQ